MDENKENSTSMPAGEQPGADELKRDFLKRFGTFAVTAPAAMYLLMSPKTSRAGGSDSAP